MSKRPDKVQMARVQMQRSRMGFDIRPAVPDDLIDISGRTGSLSRHPRPAPQPVAGRNTDFRKSAKGKYAKAGKSRGRRRSYHLKLSRTSADDPLSSDKVYGPWHDEDPANYRKAYERALKTAPHLKAVTASLLPFMARCVRASCNLRTCSSQTWSAEYTLHEAINQPWLQINHAKGTQALLFDIDHEEGLERVLALPESIRPHLVQDPLTLRSHAILVLKTPVPTKGREGPRRLLWLLQQLMSVFLEATPLPHTALVKNPLGLGTLMDGVPCRWVEIVEPGRNGWCRTLAGNMRVPTPGRAGQPLLYEVHNRKGGPGLWGLGLAWHTTPGALGVEMREAVGWLREQGVEVRKFVPPQARKSIIEPDLDAAPGRNCAIFDAARFYAYAHYWKDNYDLMGFACEANYALTDPLGEKELSRIVGSIEKWMSRHWRRRKPRREAADDKPRIRKGIMGLDETSLTLKEKQVLSADRTSALCRNRTDSKLREAVMGLGPTFTQKALAEASGVSLRTVKRRWKWVQENTAGFLAKPVSALSALSASKGVSDDGLYQVVPMEAQPEWHGKAINPEGLPSISTGRQPLGTAILPCDGHPDIKCRPDGEMTTSQDGMRTGPRGTTIRAFSRPVTEDASRFQDMTAIRILAGLPAFSRQAAVIGSSVSTRQAIRVSGRQHHA